MNKICLKIEDIFNVPSAVIYSPDELRAIRKITIDSRDVKKNSLYIAIKGKRFDGHDFIYEAIKNGASAVVISAKKLARYDDVNVPIITVKDTIKALGDIARIWRKKLNAKVIAITGSSGKTTVKDILADLLSQKYSVSKTVNNHNNHIGVPLTILNTNEKHEVLVAELGTNHFGEIPYTSGIISPDIALITNIGASHLQFLGGKAGVWEEKSSLFDETEHNNGRLFINYDDPIIKRYKSKKGHTVSFSTKAPTDVFGRIKKYTDDGRPIIELVRKDKKILLELPLYGEQSAKSFVAAAAIAMELGISKNKLLAGMKKLSMPPGRMNIIRFSNAILIDDTYNANPDSTLAAIDLAGKIKVHRRKILFLGDMLELGEYDIKFHRELAKTVNSIGASEVYTFGKLMKHLSAKLNREKIIASHFNNRKSLIAHIKKLDFNRSVILVKGSRAMQMEDFLAEIKRRVV